MHKIYGSLTAGREEEDVKQALGLMRNSFRLETAHSKTYCSAAFGMGVLYDDHESVNLYDEDSLIFTAGFRNTQASLGAMNAAFTKHDASEFNDAFVALRYDPARKTLEIFNDRYGLSPLYYYHKPNVETFVVASEIKAILADTSIEKEVNWDFWKEYFAFGYALGNKTPFKNICSLVNGTYLCYANGVLRLNSYWDYNAIEIDYKTTPDEFVMEGAEVIRRVFERQTQDLSSATVFLSGGYDSRCIASSIRCFTKTAVNSFTTNLHPGGGERDSAYAATVADRLGISNVQVTDGHDLLRKYFARHVWAVDGLCAEHMWIMPLVDRVTLGNVNFDGLGGDTLFRGPGFGTNCDNFADSNTLSKRLYKDMAAYSNNIDSRKVLSCFDADFAQCLRCGPSILQPIVENLPDTENKLTVFFLKCRTNNITLLAPTNIIARNMPCRYPFFDNEFVAYSLSIPAMLKVREEIYRKTLCKLFPSIMQVPTTNDRSEKAQADRRHYCLPPERKEIFTAESRSFLILLAETFRLPAEIDRNTFLSQVREDAGPRQEIPSYLVPLLQFIVWHEMFYKANTSETLSAFG